MVLYGIAAYGGLDDGSTSIFPCSRRTRVRPYPCGAGVTCPAHRRANRCRRYQIESDLFCRCQAWPRSPTTASMQPPAQMAQIQAEKWPSDFDTAFRYLVSQPGVTRDTIGVGGASCGVNNSVQIARRHPEVKSLVLLSGSTDLNGRQFLRTSAKLPVFFSVADDDEFPPTVQVVEWLFTLTSNPGKQLVHYANGGHGADMFPVHPELLGKIVDWYVTTLIKTPGHAPPATDSAAVPKEIHTLELIDQPGGAAKVAQILEESRQHDAKATLFSEAIVNFMGYEHMQSGDTKGAVEIMKLNAAAYPSSPNVYDSLADAYLADGQRDLARRNAEKALEHLKSDTTDPEERRKAIQESAEQKLRQLSAAPQ